jgi:hypothetical protein
LIYLLLRLLLLRRQLQQLLLRPLVQVAQSHLRMIQSNNIENK